MSIKSWIMEKKTQWLASFSRFPLATGLLLSIVLFTIMTIHSEGDSDYMNQALSAGLSVLVLVSIQVFAEIKSLNKQVVWGAKLLSLIFPLLYFFYLRQAPMDFNQAGQVRTTVLFFILSVMLIAIPPLHKRLSLSDSLIIFIKAFFSGLLISVILFIGVSAIFSAYTTLIFELDYRWFSYSAAIIFLFIAPVYLLSRLPVFDDAKHKEEIDEAKDIPPLLEILIAYIIIPVLLVFSGILIAYILTNITGDFWQDNLMEPMLISYTIIGIITLFLAENVEKKIARLFSRFYPYLLLVVAIFQTVSSSLKTADFGLTHGRYFVLLFGIFSIVSTLIYSFITSKKAFIPFLLIGLGIISILPFVDAVSIGVRDQTSKINAQAEPFIDEEGVITVPDDSLNDEEKARFSYSMNYLNEQDQLDRLDWLPDNFEYYRDFDQTFGFDSNYHYFYTNDASMPGPSGPRYVYIELDNTEPLVFPMADIDELVELSTYQGSQMTVDLNDGFVLDFRALRDELSVEILEDESSVIDYDLTFILDDIWDSSPQEPQRPLEAMQFTEENESMRLSVIVRRLEVQESSYIEGEFIILISYK